MKSPFINFADVITENLQGKNQFKLQNPIAKPNQLKFYNENNFLKEDNSNQENEFEFENDENLEGEFRLGSTQVGNARIFLTIKGEKQGNIAGSVAQKGREGSIAVYQFHHEMISLRDSASGLATGRRSYKPFAITKEVDVASTKLLNAFVTNETLKEAVINFWKQDPQRGNQVNYFRIKLTNANITNITQDVFDRNDSSQITLQFKERIEFAFQKIEWIWLENNLVAMDDWGRLQNEAEFELNNETLREDSMNGEFELYNEFENDNYNETFQETQNFENGFETDQKFLVQDWSRAIKLNQNYSNSLGWSKYYDEINNFLLPYSGLQNVSLSEEAFAKAVAEWQRSQGFSESSCDGIIGPNTWNRMKPYIIKDTFSQPLNNPSSTADGINVKISLDKVLAAMSRKNYSVYNEPYKLNIVGVRSANSEANKFDDAINVFYKNENDKWQWKINPATTDPGTYYLLNPMNVSGTAIVLPGQYINSHKIGLHHKQYTALVQQGPIRVARDTSKDNSLDFGYKNVVTGIYGINIHRASSSGTTSSVGKYSAGCQVFANINDFNEFIQQCQKHANLYGNNFTYTLLEEKDLV